MKLIILIMMKTKSQKYLKEKNNRFTKLKVKLC